MLARAEKYIPYAEYLEREAVSPIKHEWFDGNMIAMAGGTEEHAFLGMAIGAELRQALRGPCRATNSELRLRSPTTGLATYADVSVLCAPRQPHPEDPGAGVNPTLLVEVLSPSTEAYDRGEKFEHYQTFASLRDYVLVATGRNHIDHYARSADGSWALRGFGPGDRFTLSGVDVTLSVDAIYAGVEAIRETA